MNYQKIYDTLIFNARCRKRLPKTDPKYSYYERHHIVPKCMAGTNDATNLVLLTAREHFIAHLLLVKLYPYNLKIVWAASMMSCCNNKNKRNTNRTYSWIRERQSKLQTGRKMSTETKEKMSKSATGKTKPPRSAEHKMKISISNKGRTCSEDVIESRAMHLRGKSLSDEHKLKITETKRINGSPLKGIHLTDVHKEKISNSLRGVIKSTQHKEKLSQWQKGIPKHPLSDECKKKISTSLKGREKPKTICSCGKEGSIGHLKRWHKDHFILSDPCGLV